MALTCGARTSCTPWSRIAKEYLPNLSYCSSLSVFCLLMKPAVGLNSKLI